MRVLDPIDCLDQINKLEKLLKSSTDNLEIIFPNRKDLRAAVKIAYGKWFSEKEIEPNRTQSDNKS